MTTWQYVKQFQNICPTIFHWQVKKILNKQALQS